MTGKFTALLCAAALSGAGFVFAADSGAAGSGAPAAGAASATAPAAPQALSPAAQAAIAGLSSDDYNTRQAALGKLEAALGDQMRVLVSSQDPEVQARMTSLLQFNDGLTRWVLDTYKLPADQRKAMLKFGLDPDVVATVAKIYSADEGERLAGIRALGNPPTAAAKKKFESPEASALIGRLLSDPDRAVYIAAMEVAWDRKPTDAIVDPLWERAVEAGFDLQSGLVQQQINRQQQNIRFRGNPIGGQVYQDMSIYRRGQDATTACDVLIHLKAPQVAAKLKAFLDQEETGNARQNIQNMWMYNSNSEPVRSLLRLIAAYKTKAVVGMVYKLAIAPVRQRQQMTINTEKIFYSNRTAALATFIKAIGQDPKDYKITHSQVMGGMWNSGSEKDEDAAVEAVKKWWAENGAAYDAKAADKSAPATTTQPAPDNASNDIPAGNIAPMPRRPLPGRILPMPRRVGPRMVQPGGPMINGAVHVEVHVDAAPATAPAGK